MAEWNLHWGLGALIHGRSHFLPLPCLPASPYWVLSNLLLCPIEQLLLPITPSGNMGMGKSVWGTYIPLSHRDRWYPTSYLFIQDRITLSSKIVKTKNHHGRSMERIQKEGKSFYPSFHPRLKRSDPQYSSEFYEIAPEQGPIKLPTSLNVIQTGAWSSTLTLSKGINRPLV